jgi:hypothetical protein
MIADLSSACATQAINDNRSASSGRMTVPLMIVALTYLIACGLIGDPVPPVITSGGPQKKNS